MQFYDKKGNYKIVAADICTAFTEKAVGSKVTNYEPFMSCLEAAIAQADWSKSGQQVLALPPEANWTVRCGVGPLHAPLQPVRDENDFVIRKYRGKWGLYLRGKFAWVTTSVHVVVYTREAYLADPDLSLDAPGLSEDDYFLRSLERSRCAAVDYVVVAVLANTGDPTAKPPYGSTVLVHNIAGGNNQFIAKTDTDRIRLYDWFVELAKAAEEHEKEWMAVADDPHEPLVEVIRKGQS